MRLSVGTVEPRVTTKGIRYRVVNGKYFIWDEFLNVEVGKEYEVEVTDDKYPKITSIAVTPVKRFVQTPQQSPQGNAFHRQTEDKSTMMLISYAKDIALKIIEKSKKTNTKELVVEVMRLHIFIYRALTKLSNDPAKALEFVKTLENGGLSKVTVTAPANEAAEEPPASEEEVGIGREEPTPEDVF